MMDKFVNKHILKLNNYDPVDSDKKMSEEYNLDLANIIRLNANENPYGPWSGLKNSLNNLAFNTYPDPNQELVRESLSEYTGLKKDQIVAGSGADEMIEAIFKIFCNKDDSLIDVQPTFGMYSFLAESIGMNVVKFERNSDWSINIEKLKNEIISNEVRVLFLASPNNPTGNSISNYELENLLNLGILVIVDETYFEFSKISTIELMKDYANLIILRSFSKWAGIAGLRFGYMLASNDVIKNVFKVKQPYNINVAAEKAAILTLENRAELNQNIEKIINEKNEFSKFLQSLDGVKGFPSDGNFILCKFTKNSSDIVYNKLAIEGIFVRSFSNNSLKDCLRITIGTPEQMEKVRKVLITLK